MTSPLPGTALAMLAGAVLASMVLLRVAAWRLVIMTLRLVDAWPGLGASRAWQRTHTARGWARGRFPKVFASVAARFRTDRFTGLPLTLLVLAASYVVALLGGLTEEVVESGPLFWFDRVMDQAIAPWRVSPLVGVFRWVTAIGAGPALTIVSIVASAFLWSTRRVGYLVPLWVTFIGAQATTWPGKYLINRHRPAFLPGITEISPSFPSGHATASMALFGFVAYAMARDLPSVRARFEVTFWAATLILTIGFSRVFLSVHYTTDVLAGFLVGLFWILVGLTIRELPRHPPPPERAGVNRSPFAGLRHEAQDAQRRRPRDDDEQAWQDEQRERDHQQGR